MDPVCWWPPTFGIPWIFPILCLLFMVAMIFMMFRRAGGEISRQEYEEMRRRIESQ